MCSSAFDSHVNNYWINKFKKKKTKKKRIINQCGGDFVIDAIFYGDSNDDDKIIVIFSVYILVYKLCAANVIYNSRPILLIYPTPTTYMKVFETGFDLAFDRFCFVFIWVGFFIESDINGSNYRWLSDSLTHSHRRLSWSLIS